MRIYSFNNNNCVNTNNAAFVLNIGAARVVFVDVGAMPKSCPACGLWLCRDGRCNTISCSSFAPRLTDARGSWLKSLRPKLTLQKEIHQKTPQATMLPPKFTKPTLRVYKKSAPPLPELVGHSSVGRDLEIIASEGLRTPPRKHISSKVVDTKHNIRNFVQPVAQADHTGDPDAHDLSIADKDKDLMRDFVSDELLAGPLAPVVRKKHFFDIVAKPHAHTDSTDNVLLLTIALSKHFEQFSRVAGEAQSLRILAQISAMLNYVPSAASLDNPTAYAAACFIVSFELVGSWEDPVHEKMKAFVSTNISKDVKTINRCIMQLLNWMGQQ